MNKGGLNLPFSYMWKIGDIEIKGKVILAPMAGFTSTGYRAFMKKFGVDVSYSEMVSDMGLIYGNEETLTYLRSTKEERPLGIQLFGSDPENIVKAAKIVEDVTNNFDFFDINAGCPVNKVTKSGAGSSLLKNPTVLADIVKALKQNTKKPVTVKIRLGWDNSHINFMEVIRLLEEAKVDAIAIHARTTKELYSGTPHYDLLKDLQSKMSVPLIISGNIFTLDDAINALDVIGAKAVMVARGSLGNPILIKQIHTFFETGERIPNATLDEQKEYCLELARCLINEKGEDTAMRIYRSIAPKFFSGFKDSKPLRCKLAQNMSTYQYLEDTLKEYNP